jgi:hypothetical protein
MLITIQETEKRMRRDWEPGSAPVGKCPEKECDLVAAPPGSGVGRRKREKERDGERPAEERRGST